MKKIIWITTFTLSSISAFSQVNIVSTNPLAEQIMLGNYNPSSYMATTVLNRPDTISKGIYQRVSADSLKSYILRLASFRNRNTASDTNSSGLCGLIYYFGFQ